MHRRVVGVERVGVSPELKERMLTTALTRREIQTSQEESSPMGKHDPTTYRVMPGVKKRTMKEQFGRTALQQRSNIGNHIPLGSVVICGFVGGARRGSCTNRVVAEGRAGKGKQLHITTFIIHAHR